MESRCWLARLRAISCTHCRYVWDIGPLNSTTVSTELSWNIRIKVLFTSLPCLASSVCPSTSSIDLAFQDTSLRAGYICLHFELSEIYSAWDDFKTSVD